jgi:hypothetical protein
MAEAPRHYGVGMACFDPEIGSRITVTLDGKLVNQVISYDVEAGQVLRYKTDADGKSLLNEAKDDIQREVLTGVVVATLSDE